MNFKSFAEKLKKERLRRGLSIKQFCEMLNNCNQPIGEKAVYKWEQGKSLPDLRCLYVIANSYNLTISSFFDNNSNCQPLNEWELSFIENLRENDTFKRIIYLIIKYNKGGNYGINTFSKT